MSNECWALWRFYFCIRNRGSRVLRFEWGSVIDATLDQPELCISCRHGRSGTCNHGLSKKREDNSKSSGIVFYELKKIKQIDPSIQIEEKCGMDLQFASKM